MAQFPNNNFQRDTNAEHTIRCEMFVSGAATHGVELAFRGTLVADITTHLATWQSLEIQHEDEKGDVEAATGLINSLKAELEALIVQGRYFVNSVLQEVAVEGIDEHDIRRDFGVEGKVPDGVADLVDLGRQMAAINAQYIADASPYALPAAPFEEIGTVAEALSDALDARKVEHREQMHIGKLKEIERKLGDRLLSRAFKWACAVWGYDEPKLEDLGFVPKSQIWTEGDPEPGEPELPDFPSICEIFKLSLRPDGNMEVVWSGINGATHVVLEKRLEGEPDWILLIDGLPVNPDELAPFIDPDVTPGMWEYRITVYNGDVAGESKIATIEVPEV